MKTNKGTTATVILEKRIKTKDEKHPVKLRVTDNKFSKYYVLKHIKGFGLDELLNTTVTMSEDDYNVVTQAEAKGNQSAKWYKSYRQMFAEIDRKANHDIIPKINPFTFEAFEERFFDKPKDDNDVFAAIQTKADTLRKNGIFNTADILNGLLTALKTMTGKDRFHFRDITVKFLHDFQKWLLTPKTVKVGKEKLVSLRKKDKDAKDVRIKTLSQTTASIYIRALQKVFNDNAPTDVTNPFGKANGKYKIPKWKSNKRALTQDLVAKIANAKLTDGSMEHRARDYWMFSYLCNGINMKDLAMLKFSNIEADILRFERAKTARADAEQVTVTVIITRQIGRIIDRWKNTPGRPDQYLFPILKYGMTPEEQHMAIKQLVKLTNKYMKRLCTVLEIPEATTYVARHSFATVLKRSGASVEYISESLGHKDIATTANYLKDFEIDEKRKWANVLLPETETDEQQ